MSSPRRAPRVCRQAKRGPDRTAGQGSLPTNSTGGREASTFPKNPFLNKTNSTFFECR